MSNAAPEPQVHATLWVSWESAAGPSTMVGGLVSLDDHGYAVFRVGSSDTFWIPVSRIYSLSTRQPSAAESAALPESTASEAAAVIEAASQAASESASGGNDSGS